MFPAANVAMISGDGGMGKSLLGMQLMTCAVLGKAWLGMPVLRCKAMGIFCEDDLTELHMRQAAINTHYGCEFTDLGDLSWAPRVGQPNAMLSFGYDGQAVRSEFYYQTLKAVQASGAQLVILDSLHDLFNGDENRRGSAREFIGALRAMVMPQRGAIVLCSHPSMSGMSQGTGSAGSTSWNNAVRARHYLTRPEGDKPDPNQRIFKTMKSNYGPAGASIELVWQNGVFTRADQGSLEAGVKRRSAVATFLDLLDQVNDQGRPVSDKKKASNFAAAVFMGMPGRGNLQRRQFEDAMETLFASKRIILVEYGPPSDRTRKIVRVAGDVNVESED